MEVKKEKTTAPIKGGFFGQTEALRDSNAFGSDVRGKESG